MLYVHAIEPVSYLIEWLAGWVRDNLLFDCLVRATMIVADATTRLKKFERACTISIILLVVMIATLIVVAAKFLNVEGEETVEITSRLVNAAKTIVFMLNVYCIEKMITFQLLRLTLVTMTLVVIITSWLFSSLFYLLLGIGETDFGRGVLNIKLCDVDPRYTLFLPHEFSCQLYLICCFFNHQLQRSASLTETNLSI